MFAGRPVAYSSRATDWVAWAPAWEVSVDESPDDEDRYGPEFGGFLDQVGAADVEALLVSWPDAYERLAPVQPLVTAATRLTNLRGLFLGAIDPELCQLSWICHTDVTPLLVAYPKLETLKVRGASGLELRAMRHTCLRELTFHSPGIPTEVLRAVGDSDMPALERLELWLGGQPHAGPSTVADLAEILAGTHLPRLRYLGLRMSPFADELAAALADAPVVARLDELDLSMGMLSDAGAAALLAGQPLTHLRRLGLSHHFLSDEMGDRLIAELPGVDVDLSEPRPNTGFRFVSAAE
jgi:hypothetical protein